MYLFFIFVLHQVGLICDSTMEFDLQGFSEAPTTEQLFRCTKAQLMSIAEHYHMGIAPGSREKDELRTKIATVLVEQGVLPRESSQSDIEPDLSLLSFLAARKSR